MKEDAEIEKGTSIWYAQDSNGGIWKLDLSFSHTVSLSCNLLLFSLQTDVKICCFVGIAS